MRNDHDFPPADDHDYAANPKKSQAVAARQRARRALGSAPDARKEQTNESSQG